MRALTQLVALASVAYALGARTLHVLGESDDVGVLTRPVAALPEPAAGTLGDDVRIPCGTAFVSIIIVIRKGDIAVVLGALFHQMHEAFVSADPFVYLGNSRVAGIFAAILPAPQVNNLGRIIDESRHFADQFLALLESRAGFLKMRFIAMDTENEPVVIVLSGNLRHAFTHQLASIQPVDGPIPVDISNEIKTARGFLPNQQIWSVAGSTIERSAIPGVMVIACAG